MRAKGLRGHRAHGLVKLHRLALPAMVIGMLLGFASAAEAQTDAGMLIKPWDKTSRVELFGTGEFENATHFTDLPDNVRLSIFQDYGRVRLDPPGTETAIAQLGFASTFIDVQSHTRVIPNLLSDVSVAGSSGIAKIGEGGLLMKVGVGYAGNEPFGDGRAYYGLGTLALFEPLGHNDYLALGVDYDGHRNFLPDIPLPVIAYARRVSDQFNFAIGLPFLVAELKPIPNLTINGRVTLPQDINLSIGYDVAPHVTVFTNYNGISDAFVIRGVSDHHRLFFQQQRVEAGVRFGTFPFATVELAGGYAFDQAFRSGFDYRNLDNVSDVGAAPYVRAGLQLKF